jgi:hypothetical protein
MSKTRGHAPARRRVQNFTAFVHAVLEPLPDEALFDTHYNSIARLARRDAWYRAQTETQFFEALLQYVRAAKSYCKHVKQIEELKTYSGADEYDILRQKRAAVARQILTPAPSKTEVAWKRKAALDKYLPINPEDIDAAIAADEAFFAAHPTKRIKSEAAGYASSALIR